MIFSSPRSLLPFGPQLLLERPWPPASPAHLPTDNKLITFSNNSDQVAFVTELTISGDISKAEVYDLDTSHGGVYPQRGYLWASTAGISALTFVHDMLYALTPSSAGPVATTGMAQEDVTFLPWGGRLRGLQHEVIPEEEAEGADDHAAAGVAGEEEGQGGSGRPREADGSDVGSGCSWPRLEIDDTTVGLSQDRFRQISGAGVAVGPELLFE